MSKLDVLSGFETIKAATGYTGSRDKDFHTDVFPFHQSVLHHAVGEYVDLPGWTEDITDVTREEDLPKNALDYLKFVEDFVGVPIIMVGVGPGREQTFWTKSGQNAETAYAGIS